MTIDRPATYSVSWGDSIHNAELEFEHGHGHVASGDRELYDAFVDLLNHGMVVVVERWGPLPPHPGKQG